MADPNLTESAWRRAKNAAAGVYPTTAFQIGGALVTLIVGSIAAVVSADGSTSIQIAVPVLGGAAALGMTFLAVLAFQLVAAPVRQRDELRSSWPHGESASASVGPINVELTLRNQRRRGGDLLSSLDKKWTPTVLDESAIEDWTAGVIDLLLEHVDEDAVREFIEASKNAEGHTEQIDFRLGALDRIIDGVAAG